MGDLWAVEARIRDVGGVPTFGPFQHRTDAESCVLVLAGRDDVDGARVVRVTAPSATPPRVRLATVEP